MLIRRDVEKYCPLLRKSLKTVPNGRELQKFSGRGHVSNSQRLGRGHIVLEIDTITVFASAEDMPCIGIKRLGWR